MSKIFRRRGLALLSGIFALLAVAIIVTALVNDPHKPEKRPWSSWVQANLSRSITNISKALPNTGWKYFGIFKGYKEKAYSETYYGLRKQYFEGKSVNVVFRRRFPS